MIQTKLPYNPIIDCMNYHKEVINIQFKKAKGVIQTRSYSISMELAYKLFYCKDAANCLRVYNEIKANCRVLNVINK